MGRLKVNFEKTKMMVTGGEVEVTGGVVSMWSAFVIVFWGYLCSVWNMWEEVSLENFGHEEPEHDNGVSPAESGL